MKKITFIILMTIGFVAQAQIVDIPDANFKAKLLSATSNNSVASSQMPVYNPENNQWTCSSYGPIDTNGDGEIQVSEASVIQFLKINLSSIANLQGIGSFSSLKFLNCYSNQLTTIDISQNSQLLALICYQNQLTSLNITQNQALQHLSCYGNPLTSLNLTQNTGLTRLTIGFHSLNSIDVSQNTALTYFECGYAGFTSLDVSQNVNLVNLQCNNNQLTSLDVSSNTLLEILNCRYNQLTVLNTTLNPALRFIGCDFNNLEAIFKKSGNISLSNGTGTLGLDNNPNLQYVCAEEAEIVTIKNILLNAFNIGNYCHVNSYCSFTPGGTIYNAQGNIKYDAGSNGCDAGDLAYPSLKFNVTSGTNSQTLILDTSGNYSIPTLGGTHTITPQFENPTYFNVTPASVTVNFPTQLSPFIQDFCITPNGINPDMELVTIPVSPARPGFDSMYKIKYLNKGNVQIDNVTINFGYDDSVLDYISSSILPFSQNTGSLTWNVGTIAPFQSGEILVTLNVNSPTEIPAVNAGNILNFIAVVNPTISDSTPLDNTLELQQTVVNSFDPNDKTCLEGQTINSSLIGEYVHYLIRFENTGTFPAENIVVSDLINTSKFDIGTLQLVDASHNCVTRIINPNKIDFIFENINLDFNDETNDGYLVFKIKTLPTLLVNSTISNNANIYFDYNYPITTNTATSTFQVLNNSAFEFEKEFVLHPVPATNTITIEATNQIEIDSIEIYSIIGQLVLAMPNFEKTIDISNLKVGTYFVKLNTEKGSTSTKFVKI